MRILCAMRFINELSSFVIMSMIHKVFKVHLCFDIVTPSSFSSVHDAAVQDVSEVYSPSFLKSVLKLPFHPLLQLTIFFY